MVYASNTPNFAFVANFIKDVFQTEQQ